MGNLGGHSWGNSSEPPRLLTGCPPMAFSKAPHSILVQIDLIDKPPSSRAKHIARHCTAQRQAARARQLATRLADSRRSRQRAILEGHTFAQPAACLLEAFGLLIQQPYRLRNALCGFQTLSNSSDSNHG